MPRTLLLLILCLFNLALTAGESNQVHLIRTPAGGIQPQGAMDADGTIHLIYFKGQPEGGDIFYVSQIPGREAFSKPIRVNTISGSAVALGTIRGAQMALGRNGRIHVAWNGHAPEKGTYMETPMFYARLNDTRNSFEPERNLITFARGLDGGGSVTADSLGNVFVMWHAPKSGSTNGEANRAVFVSRSADDGRTFSPETIATSNPTGACGCCGMKAFADKQGNIFAMYRAATESTNRDETLLVSRNHGRDFEVAFTEPWKIGACPMSSASMSESPLAIFSAWETAGQVYFSRIDPLTLKISPPSSPPAGPDRKHPVVAGNAHGITLLAWTEGTGWGRGGILSWELFDKEGKRLEIAHGGDVPAWGLLAAFARTDGSFTIVY